MANNKLHLAFRSTIETAFYHNHVISINSRHEAYKLASVSSSTIVTDLNIKNAEALGLDKDAKVLVDNNGSIVGRTASSRHIIDCDKDYKFLKLLQDLIQQNHKNTFYKSCVHVGLDKDFEVNANVMIKEGSENNLYNTLVNFEFGRIKSTIDDVFIYVDSQWSSVDYPSGLVLLDPVSNVAAILGLRYFGEIKKAILSLVWNISRKLNYIPCHGGLKHIKCNDKQQTMAFFGLSGSGKSTITLAKHHKDFETKVLHDDAFIVCENSLSCIALEPSYFDKSKDTVINPSDNHIITAQNNGVFKDESDKIMIRTDDIRNDNGRCIKSRYFIDNRVDKITSPLKSIFWIMRDDAFPACTKIDDPTLASFMGATISTARTNAENSNDIGKLVIEPYANPFRVYPLFEDYTKFKKLFLNDVKCYILNTGSFNAVKINPQETFKIIEDILNEECEFMPFGNIKNLSYYMSDGKSIDFKKDDYLNNLKDSFILRRKFLNDANEFTWLPNECHILLEEIIETIDKTLKK
ncbi:MAG: phosphoenolpyruvate carboxykinase (ATP) [Anaerorhabdus sp.]